MAKTPKSGKAKATDVDPTPVVTDVEDAVVIDGSDQTQDQVQSEAEDFGASERPIEDRPLQQDPIAGQSDRRTSRMVVVSVLAALIGAGATYFWATSQNTDQTTTQAELARLAAQIETLSQQQSAPAEPDQTAEAMTRLEGAINQELSGIGDTIGGLSARLAEVDARMGDLAQSNAEPANPTEFANALDALRGDMSNWQTEAARLAAENEALTAEVARLSQVNDGLREQLNQVAGDLDAAKNTERLNAEDQIDGILASIGFALSQGAPFEQQAEKFAEVSGTDLPAGLLAVSRSGVATQGALQDAFPDVARAALVSALTSEQDKGVLARMWDFARAQFQVRSVVAREGESADAILSRAQAAVDAGAFEDALGQLQQLDESGRMQVEDWEQRTIARVQALNDLAGLRK